MVTRKPVAPPLSTSHPPPKSNGELPYPTTPVDSAKTTASTTSIYSPDLSNSPAFDLIDRNEALQRPRSDSESSHDTWNTDSDGDEADIPKPLNVRASQVMGADSGDKGKEKETPDRLPSILRPGGGKHRQAPPAQQYNAEAQSNPWAEQQITQTGRAADGNAESNNPYLRQNEDNSQAAWQDVKPPAPPTAAPPPPPVELPTMKSPSEELSGLSLGGDQRPASWETAEILRVPQKGQSPLPSVTEHNDSDPSRQERPMSTWWQDVPQAQNGQASSLPVSIPSPPTVAPEPQPQYAPPLGPPSRPQQPSLIDHEEPPPPKPSRPMPAPITTSQQARSNEHIPETPGTALRRQRNEHYHIKHINWDDASSRDVRQSSILTQNANGPCPLLALVNALVLSTPSNLDTALVETLRTREQVSLGLLLDAVFDELTSGRRGDPSQALPDVSELYSFLLALHTGMNVNPRFTTPMETPRGSLDSQPPDFNGIHPMHRAQSKPGAFEETREMRMYSTFGIPLIHGWTAPVDTPAYEAFVRSAQTFEDAQNIQFAESELEDKLRSDGLTPQEQQTLQDIQSVKSFLNTWPTQLTDFGLETIFRALKPGQIAILFRNDHFSTIYKEPKHGALMTLVTDTGYSSHAEIIWESLVDVSGAASEMFSGDFRVVSHDRDARLNQGNSAGGDEGWQTVQSRSRYRDTPAQQNNAPPLPGPRPQQQPAASTAHEQVDAADLGVQNVDQRKTSEQEDHDLALALQLQEEEEDQERQAQERRLREQRLSEQFLSNETEGPRPPVPPRRSGGRTGNGPTTASSGRPSGRAPVSRPADNANNSGDPPPPTYEQAWSDQPYRPAGSTATGAMAQGNPLGAYDALRRTQQGSSTTVNSQQSPPYGRDGRRQSSNNANRVRRRSSAVGGVPGAYGSSSSQVGGAPPRVGQAAGVKDAEEKCVVM